MTEPYVRRTVEAVWRIESARIVGALTRMVGDVSRGEDFAQEALLAALETWPESGVPDNPGAWLTTVARRRAIDHLRRRRRREEKGEAVGRELEDRRREDRPDPDEGLEDPIGDDVLRLMFLCCHPILSREARVALMELQASRLDARTDADGEPILLEHQDRGKWDQLLVRRGLAALERAEDLGGALGPYTLQAKIAACHARAPSADETDWVRIVALYDALAQVAPPRSWSSTRPSPSRGRSARSSGCGSWTRSARRRSWRAITCCPRSGAICSRSSAGRRRPAPSSSGRPR